MIPSEGALKSGFAVRRRPQPAASTAGTAPRAAAHRSPMRAQSASVSGVSRPVAPLSSGGGARTMSAPPPTRPTLTLLGASILGRVETKVRRVLETQDVAVKYIETRENILSSKRVVVPECQSNQDVLVLGFLGNLMLNKLRAYSHNGQMHLVGGEFLDSTEISQLIDDVCRLIGTLTQQHKKRIILLAPFPRHNKKCCWLPSHQLPESLRFPNLIDYIDLFSFYVARHPKLRVFTNLEIICHWEAFGAGFSNSWLEDGVHLTETGNDVFASFLASLLHKVYPKMPQFTDACLSFDRWVSLAKETPRTEWASVQDTEIEVPEGPPAANPPQPAQSTPLSASRNVLPQIGSDELAAAPTNPAACSTPVTRQLSKTAPRQLVPALINKKGRQTLPMSEKSLMSADTLILEPEDSPFEDTDTEGDVPEQPQRKGCLTS